jgi:hypothetical protein
MRLSEDKVRKLSHEVFDELVEGGHAEVTVDEDADVRREIKLIITRWLKTDDDIDAFARKKIETYSKKIYEGSSEWDVLYRKHYDEGLANRGRL